MNRKKKLGWWKHIDFMLIDPVMHSDRISGSIFFPSSDNADLSRNKLICACKYSPDHY